MYKVMFIFSCSYSNGAGATSQVVDFNTRDLAEEAIKVAQAEFVKERGYNYLRAVRLYA
jgi:hypothetical protein